MCGIVGYVGDRDILSVLIVGLERLSYRGYDSAGVAIVSDDEISVWKKPGKVHVLAKELESKSIDGNAGVGHTRWATHGIPNEVNSHPHFDAKRRFSVVHNGIIENYLQLKSELVKEGFLFRSQTDSETIVHLIDHDSMNIDASLQRFAQLRALYLELETEMEVFLCYGIVVDLKSHHLDTIKNILDQIPLINLLF